MSSTLTKMEEEIARKNMYADARKRCDDAIRTFATCAAERSISVVWACRQLNKDMNECLHQYTTDEELEKWKEQYAAKKKSAGVASNKFSV
ncbi:COX assembly mitochondrial protein [Plasmodiophora brassicae]|uniref:COX assembly mitochondrial protein n=1 Tax=Plasmodiophora brassicae TaxID=37360 RepID=A0A0G4IQ16_PLABS|nr:hypothetical protein PBRA_000645 [Plasmodiophora brassicae]SPQ97607.1 unnamed protein product [Plasmodiophora brassicae]